MFYSFETAREDQEAADEAARNEAALISASEGLAGYDGDWAEDDASLVEAEVDAATIAMVNQWTRDNDFIEALCNG